LGIYISDVEGISRNLSCFIAPFFLIASFAAANIGPKKNEAPSRGTQRLKRF
jgi:hypothetical protein